MAEDRALEQALPPEAPAPTGLFYGRPLSSWLLLAALLVGLWFAFDEYLAWMFDRWWKSEYYGHGLLIPPISAYLIWRQYKHLKELPDGGHLWGLPVVAVSLLLHLAATWKQVNFPSGFALIGTLYGLTIWLWGWPRAKAMWFPFAFLCFMVPLERVLVEWFSQPMQLFSAQGAGVIASLVGIENQTQGTTIITRDYTFEVAIPCSGLKSIIAMSALGALVGYVVEGARWRRWVIFASSFPMAVVGNLARIFVTIVLGNSIGKAAAEGFFHTFSGVMVFGVAFAGLMLVGGALGCRNLREDI